MKKKTAWYIVAVLILGLALLVVSCGGGASAPAEKEEPAVEETVVEEATVEEATAIPHTLEGREDCLVCHQTGAVQVTKIPADHSGRTNAICTGCHTGALAAPHTLDGREDCLACHETEAVQAAKIPTDHASRDNDTCTTCHELAE